MRGSKPAGFSGVGEGAARSLDRVSRRRGPRRAAGASLEQRDLLDDVRRVREHSRGNDAGEVVGLTSPSAPTFLLKSMCSGKHQGQIFYRIPAALARRRPPAAAAAALAALGGATRCSCSCFSCGMPGQG